jgi:quercetin dioxygenase-like cupin family protein
MAIETRTPTTLAPLHRAAGTGTSYSGPGDVYTFLVTGEESGGTVFSMEALVPSGGGPPPHIHTLEDETFYVLEGSCSFRLGDQVVIAGPGDFVFVPRGVVHCFRNEGADTARLILTFTPSGIEHFFRESLERTLDPTMPVLDNITEVSARYAAAAPRYGIEFV